MRGIATVSLAALAICGGQARSAEISVVACKLIDEAGGSNELVFQLQGDQIQSFRYLRNEGLPQCEIAASRSPSAYAWERFEWIDRGNRSEVFVYSDESEDAHVQILRQGMRIALRIVDYDRWWLCGAGQYLHPVIAAEQGEHMCILDP